MQPVSISSKSLQSIALKPLLALPTALSLGLFALWPTAALPQTATGLQSVPLCFMVDTNGRLVDLNRLCTPSVSSPQGATASRTRSPSAQSLPSTPNLGGLVNQAASPSATPCFGLDERGRPCS